MKPDRPAHKQDKPEPRPGCDRKTQEKDEMSEIHRVARKAIGAFVKNSFGRNVHAGAAAGARMAITSDQMILRVAPAHEQQAQE